MSQFFNDATAVAVITGATALLTGLISIGGTIATTWVNGWLQLQKDNQNLLIQKQIEQEEQYREKLRNIYSTCIESLSKLSSVESSQRKECLAECQKYLLLLLLHHPNNSSKAYETLYDKTLTLSRTLTSGIKAEDVVRHDSIQTIIDLVLRTGKEDYRLHSSMIENMKRKRKL